MGGLADAQDGALAPAEGAYAWRKLADLLDLLKLNRLACFRRQRVGPFTVTSGQGNIETNSPITIGPGGTWDTPRPVWIDGAGVIYTAGSTPKPELSMRVLTVSEWQRIAVKGITSTLSRALIYDQQFTSVGLGDPISGLGHIYLHPVPSASFQIVLYVPISVEEFEPDANGNPDFSIQVALPPGYRMMLISNLACILCLGVSAPPAKVEEMAKKSLEDVMAGNLVQTMDALICEDAVLSYNNPGGSWDWLGGGFY